MTLNWSQRTPEEQRLLNPSFCSILIWHAAIGHVAESAASASLAFEEAFLVLPIVLHEETRSALPKMIATSLAVWVSDHPLEKALLADTAKRLVPFTKEALLFGGRHGIFNLTTSTIAPDKLWESTIRNSVKKSTPEVINCAKRAEFVGRWFAKSGSPTTVLSILGVRP